VPVNAERRKSWKNWWRKMICSVCGMEIEGVITRCGCTMCNGDEGSIRIDGKMVGRIWKDTAHHTYNELSRESREGCVLALKKRIAELEEKLAQHEL